MPAPVTGFAVATLQLLRLEVSRSAELPVRVGIPVDAAPGLTCGQASEAHFHPVLLHQRQVIEEASERELRWEVLLCQLLAGQAVGLRQDRLALAIEILQEHAGLGTIGVRINSHLLILAGDTSRAGD